MRRDAHQAGFTIIEVVIAMGLFLIGMSSVLGLLAFGAAMTRNAALKSDAAAAAEGVMADLEERLFPLTLVDGEWVAGEPAKIVDRPLPSHPEIVYSATCVPNPAGVSRSADTLEYRVDVTLTWKNKGQRRTRSFTTLMLREVPFGERLRRLFVESSPDP